MSNEAQYFFPPLSNPPLRLRLHHSVMVTSHESNSAVYGDPFSSHHFWATPSVTCSEGPQEKEAYCELTATTQLVKEQVSRAGTDLKSMLERELEGVNPGALES